jgi:hypothetical protein
MRQLAPPPCSERVTHVLRRDLGNLEEPHGALIIDQRAALDVRARLVRHLHQKLGLGRDHVGQDAWPPPPDAHRENHIHRHTEGGR